MRTSKDCVFCKIVAGEIPCIRVFEDDKVLAFMDISPLNKGHLLVIPKEHFETMLEIDSRLYGHVAGVICDLAKAANAALNPEGMNVMQLNGKAGNQVVPHVHMHLVPRWTGDGLRICGWEPIPGDKSEILQHAEKIKAELK
ncbi:MAG: HIT family protein [Desulfomonile tiedjei]|uniref:HIT family protein n=1 Tax=Desulfomonile tiedjei TaxID=2358 RepID=A0A9D6V370_9BACT|nr:HIT family protein [Desulfomonile tiedjei]